MPDRMVQVPRRLDLILLTQIAHLLFVLLLVACRTAGRSAGRSVSPTFTLQRFASSF